MGLVHLMDRYVLTPYSRRMSAIFATRAMCSASRISGLELTLFSAAPFRPMDAHSSP